MAGPSLGQIGNIPIYNALVPKEGPRAIPLTLDFSLQQSYTIDLTLQQQLKQISLVQTAFVDNTGNGAVLVITSSGTGQNAICPAYSQAMLPLLCSNPPKLTISSTGGVSVGITLLNVPSPPGVWPYNQTPIGATGNNYVDVFDHAFYNSTVSGYLAVLNKYESDSDIVRYGYVANKIFSGNVSTTTAATLITGSPSYFFRTLYAEFTANSTLAAAGLVTLTLKDGATTIFSTAIYLGATPLNTSPIVALDLRDVQYNSVHNAAALTLTLGTSLATGQLNWHMFGGLTAQIG